MPYYSLYISIEKKIKLNFTVLSVKLMRKENEDA